MVHRSMRNGSRVADELYIKRVLMALEDFLFFSLYSFSCIASNSTTLKHIPIFAPRDALRVQSCNIHITCARPRPLHRPSGVSPSGHTIWKRALVGSQRSRQARRPPTPPQSPRKVHPGYAANDPSCRTNERVGAYTSASNLRLQKTAIHSETSKHMQ